MRYTATLTLNDIKEALKDKALDNLRAAYAMELSDDVVIEFMYQSATDISGAKVNFKINKEARE